MGATRKSLMNLGAVSKDFQKALAGIQQTANQSDQELIKEFPKTSTKKHRELLFRTMGVGFLANMSDKNHAAILRAFVTMNNLMSLSEPDQQAIDEATEALFERMQIAMYEFITGATYEAPAA